MWNGCGCCDPDIGVIALLAKKALENSEEALKIIKEFLTDPEFSDRVRAELEKLIADGTIPAEIIDIINKEAMDTKTGLARLDRVPDFIKSSLQCGFTARNPSNVGILSICWNPVRNCYTYVTQTGSDGYSYVGDLLPDNCTAASAVKIKMYHANDITYSEVDKAIIVADIDYSPGGEVISLNPSTYAVNGTIKFEGVPGGICAIAFDPHTQGYNLVALEEEPTIYHYNRDRQKISEIPITHDSLGGKMQGACMVDKTFTLLVSDVNQKNQDLGFTLYPVDFVNNKLNPGKYFPTFRCEAEGMFYRNGELRVVSVWSAALYMVMTYRKSPAAPAIAHDDELFVYVDGSKNAGIGSETDPANSVTQAVFMAQFFNCYVKCVVLTDLIDPWEGGSEFPFTGAYISVRIGSGKTLTFNGAFIGSTVEFNGGILRGHVAVKQCKAMFDGLRMIADNQSLVYADAATLIVQNCDVEQTNTATAIVETVHGTIAHMFVTSVKATNPAAVICKNGGFCSYLFPSDKGGMNNLITDGWGGLSYTR